MTADISPNGLTADSFKNLQTQIEKSAQDRLSKSDEVRLKATATAELKFSEDGNRAEYNKALSEAQEYYSQQKSTIELTGINISLNTINDKYRTELNNAEPVWANGVKDAFTNGWIDGVKNPEQMAEVPMKFLMNGIQNSYRTELKNLNISDASRAEISSFMSTLQPSESDLKQVASAALKAGKEVPENVAKGISDDELLKAISGDEDAMNYMIGKNLSTNPTFMSTLETAQGAGKEIDSRVAQGLVDNLQLVRDSATGTITGIKDSVTGKVTEITPTLKQNLQDLGVNMSNSLVTGTANNGANSAAGAKMLTDTGNGALSKQANLKKTMGDIGTNTASALTTSANKKVTDDIPTWQGMMDAIIIAVKLRFGIHSPSTVFTEIGNNIVQGLWNGIQDTWNGFIKWWTGLHIPVPHLDFGWESLDNYDNVAAKAAKKLGMKEIPTVNIKWYANGGAFDSASIIGVGEYPDATTNPEVVAPQSIIKETVEESNEGMVSVLAQILEVAQQIAQKNTTLQMDSKEVAKTINKVNSNQGYNLGLQAT